MSKSPTPRVLGIIILILLIAYLVPSITGVQTDTESFTAFQDENAKISLQPGLSVLLVNVSNTQSTVDLQVYDEENGSITTLNNLSESNSENVTVDGDNLKITYNEKIDNSSASLTYQYPRYYGWGDGPKTIMSNIVLILLVIFTSLMFYVLFWTEDNNGD